VLANDGIAAEGKSMLEEQGFEVDTEKVPQDQLAEELQKYEATVVRSATKLRKPIIDACPNLKFIGRAGVGLDNIDVDYAQSKGIKVVNTPAASSRSVAELVFAHLSGMLRHLYDANRQMPQKGHKEFKALKKQYKGRELKDRTLGILGFGRIGQATAHMALGIGMNVIPFDIVSKEVELNYNFNGQKVSVRLQTTQDKDKLLEESEFITVHVPFQEGDTPVLQKEDFGQMQDGVGIVNCARGGAVSETALLEALDSGKVTYAGLDVYENEPTPNTKLLQHERVSLTPHIGAGTEEAQQRIGIEMAEKLIDFFKN
jgi:D-3-phosphoglycerate dehydrogenase